MCHLSCLLCVGQALLLLLRSVQEQLGDIEQDLHPLGTPTITERSERLLKCRTCLRSFLLSPQRQSYPMGGTRSTHRRLLVIGLCEQPALCRLVDRLGLLHFACQQGGLAQSQQHVPALSIRRTK